MSPTSAIREELREVRSAIRSSMARERQLLAALTALGESSKNGDRPNRASASPRRRQRRRRAVSGAERDRQARDLLRLHPTEVFSANQVAKREGMSQPSAAAALRRLEAKGQVRVVAKTGRGAPVYQHKPVAVHAGHGVQHQGDGVGRDQPAA